ncbi:erythrocyte membrane antigen 1 [Plasmodium chabaudi chabaudi]|uniref:Erythrocyte membrane antigen 1 n=1 Tax=Plasmodium chabaudi chabaudi TaxID=31271 RepID=A0A4V0K087_PLACU|nr:erythrocyte membrane antigen 1 [Plasmodium chabaudi chabaudi]VTZ66351.1 erythrocyte membrane antigen 1 [Plasmodium chabaudi chabaudi]|eukprot:XP_743061.1 erythrocyte membrane antigen 1 [Plasmodium chabaudi chabaudi]
MKAISLGLISSIIFSIVLAKNSSGSGSSTGCFGCFRKKPKKKILATEVAKPVKAPETADFDPKLPNLKFIEEFEPITIEGCKSRLHELDEPFVSETDGMIIDKVTGFSRRENDSVLSGWYIRPYEEGYENMIKVNFIPLREYYKRMENRPPKQYDGPPPVPDMPQGYVPPKKEEIPVEQYVIQLSEEDPYLLQEEDALSLMEYDAETLNEGDAETLNEGDAETLNEYDAGTLNEEDAGTTNEAGEGTTNEEGEGAANEYDAETLNEYDADTLNEYDAGTLNEYDAGTLNEEEGSTTNEAGEGTSNEAGEGTANDDEELDEEVASIFDDDEHADDLSLLDYDENSNENQENVKKGNENEGEQKGNENEGEQKGKKKKGKRKVKKEGEEQTDDDDEEEEEEGEEEEEEGEGEEEGEESESGSDNGSFLGDGEDDE